MPKSKSVPHGARPTPTIQPQWGEFGEIRFKWKHVLAGAGHSDSERRELEEILQCHFKRIKIYGDFTIHARAQKGGSSDTKGLTIIRSLGMRNDVQFAYQPGDNGTRFVYAIIFPERMVRQVHEKLMESVDQERSGTVVDHTVAGQLTLMEKMIDHATKSTQAGMDIAAQAMMAMTGQSLQTTAPGQERFGVHEFRDGAKELIILQLQFDTAHPSTQILCRDLEEVLRGHGTGEIIFTIKRNTLAHTYPRKDGSTRIVWCTLQQGSHGLGFFYRADVTQDWEKFALVPDPTFEFDLQKFADVVSGKSTTHEFSVDTKVSTAVPAKKSAGVNDYASDALGAGQVLARMSNEMDKKNTLFVSRRTTIDLFRSLVTDDLDPRAVGRILTHWDRHGWIRRLADKYNVDYTLGEKADKVLPVTDLGVFYKMYPRRRSVWVDVAAMPEASPVPPTQLHDVEDAVVVADDAPAVSAPAISFVSNPETRVEVPDYDGLTGKLQKALARLQSVQVIKDEINGFDVQIDAVEAEIAALESKRTALAEARAAAFARLPTAEELQKIQALAAVL